MVLVTLPWTILSFLWDLLFLFYLTIGFASFLIAFWSYFSPFHELARFTPSDIYPICIFGRLIAVTCTFFILTFLVFSCSWIHYSLGRSYFTIRHFLPGATSLDISTFVTQMRKATQSSKILLCASSHRVVLSTWHMALNNRYSSYKYSWYSSVLVSHNA